MLRFVPALLLCIALAQPAAAQDSIVRHNSLEVWCAGTLANGHILGYADERRLTTCNVGFSHPLFSMARFTVGYAAAVTPMAWLSEPAAFDADSAALSSRRKHVFGAGASPVGIQIIGPSIGRVRPMLEGLGGFLYFAERVLSPRASQFNFTIEIAPSVTVSFGAHSAIVGGFRYHHMSNAKMTDKNPGVDSEILYLGLRLFK